MSKENLPEANTIVVSEKYYVGYTEYVPEEYSGLSLYMQPFAINTVSDLDTIPDQDFEKMKSSLEFVNDLINMGLEIKQLILDILQKGNFSIVFTFIPNATKFGAHWSPSGREITVDINQDICDFLHGVTFELNNANNSNFDNLNYSNYNTAEDYALAIETQEHDTDVKTFNIAKNFIINNETKLVQLLSQHYAPNVEELEQFFDKIKQEEPKDWEAYLAGVKKSGHFQSYIDGYNDWQLSAAEYNKGKVSYFNAAIEFTRQQLDYINENEFSYGHESLQNDLEFKLNELDENYNANIPNDDKNTIRENINSLLTQVNTWLHEYAVEQYNPLLNGFEELFYEYEQVSNKSDMKWGLMDNIERKIKESQENNKYGATKYLTDDEKSDFQNQLESLLIKVNTWLEENPESYSFTPCEIIETAGVSIQPYLNTSIFSLNSSFFA